MQEEDKEKEEYNIKWASKKRRTKIEDMEEIQVKKKERENKKREEEKKEDEERVVEEGQKDEGKRRCEQRGRGIES